MSGVRTRSAGTVFDEAKKLQEALAKLDTREAADLARVQSKYADARLALEAAASEGALRLVEAAKPVAAQ